MSETDIEDVANSESEPEAKAVESPSSERFMSHIERQAEIIERQAQMLEEMKAQLSSFGKQEPAQEEEDAEDDSEYITKKQLTAMEKRVSAEAEKRVLERSYKEKVEELNKEISRPEISKVINQMFAEDELFKETIESVFKADPLKGRQLVLKRAKQAMAKTASVPKAMTGASTGSSGNAQIAPQSQQNAEITHINFKSTPEQKEAFAKTLYNKFVRN